MAPAMRFSVTISATVLGERQGPAVRTIILTDRDPSVEIGRSSTNISKNLKPGPHNLYFDSPIMSRTHARLTATDAKTIKMRDLGSLHGTSVDGTALRSGQDLLLNDGAVAVFGEKIERAGEIFHAEKLRLNVEWDQKPTPSTTSYNTGFGLADYDGPDSMDEEEDSLTASLRMDPSTRPPKPTPTPTASFDLTNSSSEEMDDEDDEDSVIIEQEITPISSSPELSDRLPPKSSQATQPSQSAPSGRYATVECEAELVDIEIGTQENERETKRAASPTKPSAVPLSQITESSLYLNPYHRYHDRSRVDEQPKLGNSTLSSFTQPTSCPGSLSSVAFASANAGEMRPKLSISVPESNCAVANGDLHIARSIDPCHCGQYSVCPSHSSSTSCAQPMSSTQPVPIGSGYNNASWDPIYLPSVSMIDSYPALTPRAPRLASHSLNTLDMHRTVPAPTPRTPTSSTPTTLPGIGTLLTHKTAPGSSQPPQQSPEPSMTSLSQIIDIAAEPPKKKQCLTPTTSKASAMDQLKHISTSAMDKANSYRLSLAKALECKSCKHVRFAEVPQHPKTARKDPAPALTRPRSQGIASGLNIDRSHFAAAFGGAVVGAASLFTFLVASAPDL